MTQKISRDKYECLLDGFIYWSEKAVQRHIKKIHKEELENGRLQRVTEKKSKEQLSLGKSELVGEGYIKFYEPEFCPFIFPHRKIICTCEMPISTDIWNNVVCPCLINEPDIAQKFKSVDIAPGIYTGIIESMELINERLKFVFVANDKRYTLESSKTTAFEILKRTVSKELSRHAQDSNQRIWDGFIHAVARPKLMDALFDKAIRKGITFNIEIKPGPIIGKVRVSNET